MESTFGSGKPTPAVDEINRDGQVAVFLKYFFYLLNCGKLACLLYQWFDLVLLVS